MTSRLQLLLAFLGLAFALSCTGESPLDPLLQSALSRPTDHMCKPSGLHPCLISEEFNSRGSPPGFEIRPGKGTYTLSARPGAFRYLLTAEPEEQASLRNSLTFDDSGHPALPSLQLRRTFSGTRWILETTIDFNLPPHHGRNVHIWIVFENIFRGPHRALRLSRRSDVNKDLFKLRFIDHSPGRDSRTREWKGSPDLGMDMASVRVVRDGNRLGVYMARPGQDYKLITGEYFPYIAPLPEAQTFLFNSSAFSSDGAHADLLSLHLLGRDAEDVAIDPPDSRTTFARSGTPKERARVEASTVLAELGKGHNVELDYVEVAGHLNLAGLPDRPGLRDYPDLVCKDRAENQPEPKIREVIGRIAIRNSTVAALTAPRHVVFRAPVELESLHIGRLELPGACFGGPVVVRGSRVDRLKINDAVFSEAVDMGFSQLTSPQFRASMFRRSVSFYGVDFEGGADFTGSKFGEDVSFGRANLRGTITLSDVSCEERILLTATVEKTPDTGEVNLTDATIDHLRLSSERERWYWTSKLILRRARMRNLELINVGFTDEVDVSGLVFTGHGVLRISKSTFGKLPAFLTWPVRRTDMDVQLYQDYEQLYHSSRQIGNERLVRFDRKEREAREADGRHAGSQFVEGVQRLVREFGWFVSRYGTDASRLFGISLLTSLGFGLIIAGMAADGLCVVRKPRSFKFHLTEVPMFEAGMGEEIVGVAVPSSCGERSKLATLTRIRDWSARLLLSVEFSVQNLLKIGFGRLKVDPARFQNPALRRVVVTLVWVEWALGYVVYLALAYTLVASAPFIGSRLG